MESDLDNKFYIVNKVCRSRVTGTEYSKYAPHKCNTSVWILSIAV